MENILFLWKMKCVNWRKIIYFKISRYFRWKNIKFLHFLRSKLWKNWKSFLCWFVKALHFAWMNLWKLSSLNCGISFHEIYRNYKIVYEWFERQLQVEILKNLPFIQNNDVTISNLFLAFFDKINDCDNFDILFVVNMSWIYYTFFNNIQWFYLVQNEI